MFKYIFIFLISLPVTTFANFYDDLTSDKSIAAKEIEKKYQVKCIGSGGGAMYGVKFIALSFEIKRPLSIEQAREMMVGSVAIVQDVINSDKNIRPFLEEYPFTSRDIELSFSIHHPEAKELSFFKSSKTIDGEAIIKYSKFDKNDQLIAITQEKFSIAKELINEKK